PPPPPPPPQPPTNTAATAEPRNFPRDINCLPNPGARVDPWANVNRVGRCELLRKCSFRLQPDGRCADCGVGLRAPCNPRGPYVDFRSRVGDPEPSRVLSRML